MTYRTFTSLQCDCGHVVKIVESDNDLPYSKEYPGKILSNIDMKGHYSDEHKIIANIRPTRPNFGQSLTPMHIIKTSGQSIQSFGSPPYSKPPISKGNHD